MGQDAVTSLVFMIGIIVANVRISASRRVETPSRHRRASSPGEQAMGGLFFDFEAIRTKSRDHGAHTGGSSGAPVGSRARSTTTGRTWCSARLATTGLMMLALSLD